MVWRSHVGARLATLSQGARLRQHGFYFIGFFCKLAIYKLILDNWNSHKNGAN